MSMKKSFKTFVVLSMVAMLSGCTSNTMYSLDDTEWEILPDKSQIVVFSRPYSAALEPLIWLNDKETDGACASGSVFVLDVEPGDYEVAIKRTSPFKMTPSSVSIKLERNKRAYILCDLTFNVWTGGIATELRLFKEFEALHLMSFFPFKGRF